MTTIAEQVAAEHHPTTPVQCICGWRGTDVPNQAYAAHVAEVTERAVRAAVAAELRVHMRYHDGRQVGFSAIGDAYAHAARIAEGNQP